MKNKDSRVKSSLSYEEIVRRSVVYSLRIISVYHKLEKIGAGKLLGKHLLKSGTSIGIKIHEAQSAKDDKDFVTQMLLANKDAEDSAYWLNLLRKTKLITSSHLAELTLETEKLIDIISSIIKTSSKTH